MFEFLLHVVSKSTGSCTKYYIQIMDLSRNNLALKFLPLAAEHSDTIKGDLESTGCVHRALGEGGGDGVVFSAVGPERGKGLGGSVRTLWVNTWLCSWCRSQSFVFCN